MPNWNSNYFSTSNPQIIARLKDVAIDATEDGGIIKDLLGTFVPMPVPLTTVVTGFRVIDGQKVRLWTRNEDGTETALPDETRDAWERAYGYDNWYGWALANWGTKWDTDAEAEFYPDHVVLRFDTAWAPPTRWLEKIVAECPEGDTVLAFAEGAMGFFGTIRFLNGELIEDYESQDYYLDQEWDDDTDPMDMLSEAARAHSEEYGVI